MTTAVFTVSEAEFGAAHAMAYRAKWWTGSIRWMALAMAAAAIVAAGYELARGAGGPTIGEIKLATVGLLVAGSAQYEWLWGADHRARRIFRRVVGAAGPITAVWSEDNLSLSDGQSSSSHSWSEFTGWREGAEVFAAWSKSTGVLTFPKRVLEPAVLQSLKSKLATATKATAP